MQEDNIIVDNFEEEYDVINILEEDQDITPEETIDIIDVGDVEIFSVDTDEAFSALGEPNEQLRHQLLTGRDTSDQHPIIAITGLREELDDIESLKTVYSDKKQLADYYEWEDGNILNKNRVGYFVSICEDIRAIKICDEENVFGVTIDNAAFVGGQDDIARDSKYGLVIYSGVADVICELDVEVGNCVLPNNYGMAKKTTSGYGYSVVAINNKNDVKYATILLNLAASQMDTLSESLNTLSGRMDDAETNIVAAVNLANEAYNKAGEIGNISGEAVKNASEALEKANGASEKTDGFEARLEDANILAVQAKAIAESAAVSAESIRNEAVEFANNALAETSKLRKEFETKVDEIDVELENTELELEETKMEFNATIDGLRLDAEGQLADFKKEVADNYATTTQLAAVKTENADIVAALKQEATAKYATIESVASLKTETSNALAGFKQEASETYATQEMLTSLETESSKALTDYKQEVTDTYATQEMVSKLETDTTKALTDYKQEVGKTYATQEMVTKLETDTSEALSDYKQEVTDTYATQSSLTTLRTDTTNAIAASEEKATTTYASKSDLTSFENDTNNNMARVEQKADENGASINSIVSSVDKYSVGEYSQAYGLTLEQAQSILTKDMIYIPIGSSHSEKYEEFTQNFSSGYYYTWDGTKWIESGSNAVIFSATKPAGTAYKYWYIDSNTAPEEYEPYTLYVYNQDEGVWDKVNILSGNVNNRLTSMIRQEADKISLAVANAQGSIAGLETRLSAEESQTTALNTWKTNTDTNIAALQSQANANGSSISQIVSNIGSNGKVNAASIVTAINNSGDSSIVLDADHIDIANWSVEGNSLYSKFGTEADGKYTILKSDGQVTFAAGVPWGNNPDTTTGAQLQIYHNGRINFGYNGSGYNVVIDSNGTSKIGGWNISSDMFGIWDEANTDNRFYLSQAGKSSLSSTFNLTDTWMLYFGGKTMINTTGKLYTSDAVINGEVTTIDGLTKTTLASGELVFFYNNKEQGSITGKYSGFTSLSNGLKIDIPSKDSGGIMFLMFSHGGQIDYEMHNNTTGLSDGGLGSIRHTFYGGICTLDGLLVYGNIYQYSHIYLQNSCTLSWYDKNNGGPHQLISFDSSNVLNIGSSSYTTHINSQLTTYSYITLPNGIALRAKQYNSDNTTNLIYLGSTNNIFIGGGVSTSNHILLCTTTRPNANESYDLGTSDRKWRCIYALDSQIGSDRRIKKNIEALSDIHSELFDKLQPVQYEFIDSLDRIYYGLIAQDVEASMMELGIEADDLGLVRHDYHVDDTTGELVDEYTIGYNNLIPMLIHEVQKLKKEIKTLKGE